MRRPFDSLVEGPLLSSGRTGATLCELILDGAVTMDGQVEDRVVIANVHATVEGGRWQVDALKHERSAAPRHHGSFDGSV